MSEEKKALQERLNALADELIEHCEGVVILAAVKEDQADSVLYAYRGTIYTSIGMMEKFKLSKFTEYLQNNKEEQEGHA